MCRREPFQADMIADPVERLKVEDPDAKIEFLDVHTFMRLQVEADKLPLTDEAALRIDYEATTDRATPLSLTNHSYFNLAGESAGSVKDHLLEIYADTFVPLNQNLTLSGKIESVEGKPNDLNRSKRIGDVLHGFLAQHGDNYIIWREEKKVLVPVARVEEPISGRVMEVESTEACLQFYSGVFLGEAEVTGRSGRVYRSFDGLCLECHGYPDGMNHPEIDEIVLRPGETYRQTTIYRFSSDQE